MKTDFFNKIRDVFHKPLERSRSQSSGQLRAQPTLQEARRTVSTNRRPVEMSSVKRAEPKSPKSSPKSAELKPARMPKLSSDECFALAQEPAPKILMRPDGLLEAPAMYDLQAFQSVVDEAAELAKDRKSERAMPGMRKLGPELDNARLESEVDRLVDRLTNEAIFDPDQIDAEAMDEAVDRLISTVRVLDDREITSSATYERVAAEVEAQFAVDSATQTIKGEKKLPAMPEMKKVEANALPKQRQAWRPGMIPGRGPATAPQQASERPEITSGPTKTPEK